MKNKSYKTNITCSGCINNVTPLLNEIAGTGNWEVDLSSKAKTLTISEESTDDVKLIAGLKDLGYLAEKIESDSQ